MDEDFCSNETRVSTGTQRVKSIQEKMRALTNDSIVSLIQGSRYESLFILSFK